MSNVTSVHVESQDHPRTWGRAAASRDASAVGAAAVQVPARSKLRQQIGARWMSALQTTRPRHGRGERVGGVSSIPTLRVYKPKSQCRCPANFCNRLRRMQHPSDRGQPRCPLSPASLDHSFVYERIQYLVVPRTDRVQLPFSRYVFKESVAQIGGGNGLREMPAYIRSELLSQFGV